MGRWPHRCLLIAVGLVVAMGLAGWSAVAGAAESYAVDPVHSSAFFRIEHCGISWVAGRFNDVSGKCSFDKGDPAKSTCEVTIKTTSIDTNNAQRDTHLRSEEFFDVKQFPDMTFKSTSVKKAAGEGEDAAYEVTGDFTLRGVTKPVTLILRGGKEAEFPKGTNRIGFFAEFSLKRSDYGMSKLLGAVGDLVKIIVSVEAIKQ